MPALKNEIEKQLPGFNCRACGYEKCRDFAEAFLSDDGILERCPYLQQERYKQNRDNIKSLMLRKDDYGAEESIKGVIDKYRADFILEPLEGEPSCREILFPFCREEMVVGSYIKYRPLGCPIPHFAKIIGENKGLITIHLVGPCRNGTDTRGEQFEDIGVCMVGGFIGLAIGGRPAVGSTVRFIPSGCMMQKVHSGVVVQAEGDKLHIEGIDLKVWALPEI